MKRKLPDLSRFEIQCLKRLWSRREGTVRDVQSDLPGGPSYSTVRKIFERLEEKGAVTRARRDGKAWVYRPAVSAAEIVRKEVRRLLESLFDGGAVELVSHLADMKELTLDDLRGIEEALAARPKSGRGGRGDEGREGS